MKTLKYINTFIILLLIVSSSLSIINNESWIAVMILLFIMGCFQGISGLILFFLHPKSIRLQLYIGGLVLFISTCYIPISNLWMILPIPLLLYFTFMIHTVYQKKHEYKTFKTV